MNDQWQPIETEADLIRQGSPAKTAPRQSQHLDGNPSVEAITIGPGPLNMRRFLLMALCTSLLGGSYFMYRHANQLQGLVLLPLLLSLGLSYAFLLRKRTVASARCLIWGIWSIATVLGLTVMSIKTPMLYVFPGVLMAGCWILPRREYYVLLGLSLLVLVTLALGESQGWLLAHVERDEWDYLAAMLPITITGALASLTINNSFVAQYRRARSLGKELGERLEELSESEKEVRRVHQDLRQLADNVPAMIAMLDGKGRYRFVNLQFARLLGSTPDALAGTVANDEVLTLISTSGRSRRTFSTRENNERHLDVEVVSVNNDASSGCYALIRDVSEVVHAEEQLRHMATHDPLTGLPNRLFVQSHLTRAINRAQRNQARVAVMFIDLDDFKGINDTLGHDSGDQVLREVATRMANCLRNSDVIARLGGDEFIIVLEDITDTGIVHAAGRLIAAMNHPITVQRVHNVHTEASIGIACFPADGDNPGMLLRNADTAMYRAKAQGRGRFCFYESSMTDDAMDRLKTLALLREALRRDEFHLVLQPQIHIGTGQLMGAEALIRWTNPELGAVSPARFIPLAEEMGMIHEIGRWVFQEACRQWRVLANKGMVLPKLAVNIAAVQLERGDLAGMVESAALASDVPLDVLQIEVTETILAGLEDAQAHLEALRASGLSIAIDDFGTGHSSLSRLKTFPLHTLKIDRSFVQDLGHDPESEAIVRIIIELARLLNIDLVAEGVETREQADFLLTAGCSVAQGYLYARPQTSEEIFSCWKSRQG